MKFYALFWSLLLPAYSQRSKTDSMSPIKIIISIVIMKFIFRNFSPLLVFEFLFMAHTEISMHISPIIAGVSMYFLVIPRHVRGLVSRCPRKLGMSWIGVETR